MKKRILLLLLCISLVAVAIALTACGGDSDIVELTVVEGPTKKEYVVGEKIDLTGLVVVGTKADGSSTNPLNITEDMISFDSSQIGTTTVTIAYPISSKNTVYQTFTVKITEAKAVKLDILTNPTKTAYVDGQSISLEGLTAKITFSDGEEVEANYTAFTFSPSVAKLSDAKEGEVKVTVYKGAKATAVITITVEEKKAIGFEVATHAKKTEYIDGEFFEVEGLTLLQRFNDGSFIPISTDELNFDNSVLLDEGEGGCNVTLTFDLGSFDYWVKVTPKVIKDIIIATKPDKHEYRIGEEITIDGLVLYLVFQNAESEFFPYNSQYNGVFEYEIQYAKEGQTYVELIMHYRGNETKTIQVPITVNPLMAIDLINTGFPIEDSYEKEEGAYIDLRNLSIVAMFNDDFTEELVLWGKIDAEGISLALAEGATLMVTRDKVDVTNVLIVDEYKLMLEAEGSYIITVTYQGLKWMATFTVA